MIRDIRKMFVRFVMPVAFGDARELGKQFGARCSGEQLSGFLAGLAIELHKRPEEQFSLGKQTRQQVSVFAATVLANREARKSRGM